MCISILSRSQAVRFKFAFTNFLLPDSFLLRSFSSVCILSGAPLRPASGLSFEQNTPPHHWNFEIFLGCSYSFEIYPIFMPSNFVWRPSQTCLWFIVWAKLSDKVTCSTSHQKSLWKPSLSWFDHQKGYESQVYLSLFDSSSKMQMGYLFWQPLIPPKTLGGFSYEWRWRTRYFLLCANLQGHLLFKPPK